MHVMAFAGMAPAGLAELRVELVREVQARLSDYERAPTPELRGRIMQLLDDLALLVRAEPTSPGRPDDPRV